MIRLALPWLPPSVNNAYITGRGGERALSEEARKFKTEAPAHLARLYHQELRFFVDKKDTPLSIAACFTFTQLQNKGWPAKKGTSRYKKVDASNRIKFLEDVLVLATGVDDSQNFTVALCKRQGPTEKTDIWAWDPGGEESPFDAVFSDLIGMG